MLERPSNEERCTRAEIALEAYLEHVGYEYEGYSVIQDLITDLFHLINRIGLDSVEKIVLLATMNYEYEGDSDEQI